MKKTACPLDCYDACSIVVEEKLKGDKDHPITKGHLCYKLNHYYNYPQLNSAYYKGEKISIKEALDILEERLKSSKNTLFFRGSGNVGKMQNVTDLFFSKIGATFTEGSLCDAAGQLGIIEGRGKNLILPISQIKKSELVIVWGRNITSTNSHILPFLSGKTVVVIDPVKTDIAKRASMHLQINPRTDLELACMLARFIYMQNAEDEEFIENKTEDYEFFADFIRTYRIVPTVDKIGIDVLDVATLAELMSSMKTVILVGNGVQKYSHGTEVVRMIDSLAAMLGLFGKEGCGVSFLGDTAVNLDDPFRVEAKRVQKAVVDFSKFDVVFIQGSNPVVTMPNSKRVIEGLKNSFSVVFGLYMDETAKLADLVIPAKNFLQKKDIRFSYGHEYVELMPKLQDNDKAISEYEFTKEMFKRFNFDGLKDEDEYIEHFKKQLIKDGDYYKLPSFMENPYSDDFYTDAGLFCFLDEVEDEFDHEEEGFYLITPKCKTSLNSQFKRDNFLYVHPSTTLKDGDIVIATSRYGEAEFEVRVDENLKENLILAYSGNEKVNFLTPSKTDNYGNNAIFQEVKIKIRKKI
ncbi:molybdopterin-containing oxidoreductase family protein [Nitrosophilus kaiyonis]|uniref:molybdopterin-containing oxidoreductase family protein n=1 Tax=Nitrosophilus kaiyonis TaxID=2930200 RepID=UPI002492DBE6|nr:molybdopterin-dependent oxidoreductase [Nitrosophilus kaiyonis]